MSDSGDLVDALLPVARILQELNIPHFVGGSVASSFHGATRSTMDVDLVCELTDADITRLLNRIDTDYYASESAMRDAVQRKTCFNLIHLPTSFKVDIFVSRQRPFDQLCMSRAVSHRLGSDPHIVLPIATAEDSMISKLEWYQLTNETSERQWDDVTKLRDLLGEKVDRDYLLRAAESVGVVDLLQRLMNA